jgi:retron-type reverse transcriptase
MNTFSNLFEEMTSAERLFDAWLEFRKGKTKRKDVQEFGRYAERNIFRLHRDLISEKYRHGEYTSFFVHDPKLRHIRKACVRDRLVHQTIYTTLRQIYEPRFIDAVYSSIIGKGTHRAVEALRRLTWKVSRNGTRECWGLKCDVRRFYDSVDHETLFSLLQKPIKDERARRILKNVIESFHVEGAEGKGTPIGNLTSQIFTNIYLNEFDQFVKHSLRVKHYLRFADDCLFLSHKKSDLEKLIPEIENFLRDHLKLTLHPDKVILRPLTQGIDFLGYITFPHHRVLRTTTKRRMFRKLGVRHDEFYQGKVTGEGLNQSLQSYLGILSHADTHELSENVKNIFSWRED